MVLDCVASINRYYLMFDENYLKIGKILCIISYFNNIRISSSQIYGIMHFKKCIYLCIYV